MRGVTMPNLTPQDVRNVAFNKPAFGRRGYDEEQVDAFLDAVAGTITALTEEITSLRAQSDRGRPPTTEGSIVAELGEIKVRLTRIEAAIADGGRRYAAGDPMFDNHS
jgi:DivIVA domain-containing protein